MKAIILAAGRGSRLKSLTDKKPKALIKLNGVPLIRRMVDTLREGGVTEIGIVGGYKHKMLIPYADRMFINYQWDHTGIFQSLRCAHEWIEAHPCLVSYGDIFYSSNLVRDLISSTGNINLAYDINAISLWSQRFANPLEDLELFSIKDRIIESIGGRAKNLNEIMGQYMGLFKLTPSGWKQLSEIRDSMAEPKRSNVDMTSLFSAMIHSGTAVAGVPNSVEWGEIDCPSDVTLYERLYPAI